MQIVQAAPGGMQRKGGLTKKIEPDTKKDIVTRDFFVIMKKVIEKTGWAKGVKISGNVAGQEKAFVLTGDA